MNINDTVKKQIEEIQKNYNQFPIPIVNIAKGLGIEIYATQDLNKSESGAITREGDKYVIYLNISDSPKRKRFTIAHEIGHFLLHKDILDSNQEFIDYKKQITNNSPTLHRREALTTEERKQEVEANLIAAELLMPEKEFRKQWECKDTIEEIAAYFNVSEVAATVRANSLLGEVII